MELIYKNKIFCNNYYKNKALEKALQLHTVIRLIITVNGRNFQRIWAHETEQSNVEDRGWLCRLS